VKPEHRLGVNNPTFRGNLLVSEGAQASTAILSQSDGIVLQDLPFSIELKKFIIEHYSTGMPKLFASEIVIHDKATGEKIPARVEVNHPASYKGVEIYQSSFDDGGSRVKLKALPMSAAAKAFEIEGVIGGSSQLTNGSEKLTLEYTALRVMNIENLSGGNGSAVDVRKVDLRASVEQRLGAANKADAKKVLHNVGPSITYKLRDAAGQAREFHNYMLPIDLGDGLPVYLMGLRDTPTEAFRYLRVPADAQGSSDDFFRLRDALATPALREQAVRRYARKVVDASRPDLLPQLTQSAERALALFAGAEAVTAAQPGKTVAGLQAVADFIEVNVPEAERERAGEVLIRILNGALFELTQISRERVGLKALEPTEKTQAWMTQAVLALSDTQVYPAPMVLQLADFTQVQASVFQVARAPGKTIVYLGCALLILGIFAMLYVRERRLWIWLAPQDDRTEATLALSTNRKTMDGDKEFVQLREKLLGTT
jgi:cytochrome c biogenesis protein